MKYESGIFFLYVFGGINEKSKAKVEMIVTLMKKRSNYIVILVIAAVINTAAVWGGKSSTEPADE